MKVQKRNIVEIILHAVCIILLFIPGTYLLEHWEWDKDASTTLFGVSFHGYMSLAREEPLSYISSVFNPFKTTALARAIGVVFLFVVFATLVIFLLQYLGKKVSRNSKLAAIFSVLSAVAFIVSTIVLCFSIKETTNFEFRYTLNWLWYILMIAFAATATVVVIGYFQANRVGVMREVTPSSSPSLNHEAADELLKYKKLLDDGIISDEDFSIIKNRLLFRREKT